MGYADLHIHSLYSDGTLSPAEIVAAARARAVDLIAVCDHNAVAGTQETLSIARSAGLRCVSGVEIDALHGGVDLHILCYGADLTDAALLKRIRRARERLDEMSVELLRRLLPHQPRLSMAEYEGWTHDSARGGWKLLQYLQAKGVTARLHDGFALYERWGVTYAQAGFDPAEDVVKAIHGAGGRAVLAHPGVVFPTGSLGAFARRVEEAFELGIDGVECHYPRHSAGTTRALLEICQRRGAMITAGSDCHGAFNHNEIGQTKTPSEALRLNGLHIK